MVANSHAVVVLALGAIVVALGGRMNMNNVLEAEENGDRAHTKAVEAHQAVQAAADVKAESRKESHEHHQTEEADKVDVQLAKLDEAHTEHDNKTQNLDCSAWYKASPWILGKATYKTDNPDPCLASPLGLTCCKGKCIFADQKCPMKALKCDECTERIAKLADATTDDKMNTCFNPDLCDGCYYKHSTSGCASFPRGDKKKSCGECGRMPGTLKDSTPEEKKDAQWACQVSSLCVWKGDYSYSSGRCEWTDLPDGTKNGDPRSGQCQQLAGSRVKGR